METLSDFDLGWLVGIFEGEGCFSIYRKVDTALQLVSTDKDTIERAKAILKIGYINGPYSRTNRKPYWEYKIHGPKAIPIMKMLQPYMSDRRKVKIQEIIDMYLLPRKPHANVAGSNNPMFGRKFSEEHKRKLSEAAKKRKVVVPV